MTARLVSLNRARRGAYNDIDVVNSSGGLVVLQLGFENEYEIENPSWRWVSVLAAAF